MSRRTCTFSSLVGTSAPLRRSFAPEAIVPVPDAGHQLPFVRRCAQALRFAQPAFGFRVQIADSLQVLAVAGEQETVEPSPRFADQDLQLLTGTQAGHGDAQILIDRPLQAMHVERRTTRHREQQQADRHHGGGHANDQAGRHWNTRRGGRGLYTIWPAVQLLYTVERSSSVRRIVAGGAAVGRWRFVSGRMASAARARRIGVRFANPFRAPDHPRQIGEEAPVLFAVAPAPLSLRQAHVPER
jgi:hypothetical protein